MACTRSGLLVTLALLSFSACTGDASRDVTEDRKRIDEVGDATGVVSENVSRGRLQRRASDLHVTYLRHLLTARMSPREMAGYRETLSNAIRQWNTFQTYWAVHGVLNRESWTRVIGIEQSGDAGENLDVIWIIEVSDGAHHVLSCKSFTLCYSDSYREEQFDTAFRLVDKVIKAAPLFAVDNVTHATCTAFVVWENDATPRVALWYGMDPMAKADAEKALSLFADIESQAWQRAIAIERR